MVLDEVTTETSIVVVIGSVLDCTTNISMPNINGDEGLDGTVTTISPLLSIHDSVQVAVSTSISDEKSYRSYHLRQSQYQSEQLQIPYM